VNSILWIAQVALALAFLGAGYDQALNYNDARRRLVWVGAISRPAAMTIGGLEALGAIGLVLPGLLGIGWLTAATAFALAVLMAAALAFHARRGELVQFLFGAAFLALALFVAVGRAFIAPN
jgi:hypothetical protein